ncbi:amidohydrolase family protein [Komagataeibacter xylinus]|nr:amidohydrolase family protein [Komagataeibacter xylinus]
MMKRAGGFFILGMLICGGVTPAAAGTIAIVGGMVFDGTGAAARRGTILIQDDRITAVGRDVTVPADARVIDVHGMAVTPGLYDLHTHWGLEGTPADVPSIAHAYLVSGVTTVNDFNEETEAFAPLRTWLVRMPAPHVNFAARISTPGGHGADWSDQDTTRWASTAASGKAAIDSVVAYHPDLIKIFTDGWRYGRMPDDTSMNEQTLAAAVAQAHADHLKVMTHTVTVERGLLAARAKVDSLAHSMQDRVLTSADIATIRASGMGDIATLAVYDPDKWRRVPEHKVAPNTRLFDNALKNVRKLYKAGVPIGVGTDAGMPATPHGESTLHELELLVRAGLTPAQALVAATRVSATLQGQQTDRGTIAPGMRADITVFDGRPWKHIADIHHVAMTMVDGRPLIGLGALPDQASGTGWPAPVPAGRLIDDFERADGRSSLNTLRRDTMDWGQDRTEEVSGTMTRETGRGKILFMAARMADKKDAYAGVAVPLSTGSVLPVDVTAYKGITLEIRGAACPSRLTVTGTVGATWSAPVNMTQGWQTIHVPFSALQVVDPKVGRAWNGRDVTEVEIGQSCPAEHKSWLQADNLAFYSGGTSH